MSNENLGRGAADVTLELIASRSSVKKFVEQVPTRGQIETLLAAASRAPDHGRLAPWRFTVLQGAAREISSWPWVRPCRTCGLRHKLSA
ncbi:MAG: hypothetical protein EBZ91_05820 [Gammaproteobacteria bacterium]|nr:hypothetical protein [Gammaproteobacteria bacterium]